MKFKHQTTSYYAYLIIINFFFFLSSSSVAQDGSLTQSDISHKLSISPQPGLDSSMALIVDSKFKIQSARALFSIEGNFITLNFTKKDITKNSSIDHFLLKFPTPNFKSKKKSTYKLQLSYGEPKEKELNSFLSKTYKVKSNCQESGFNKVVKKAKKGSPKHDLLRDIYQMENSSLFLKQINSKLTKAEGKI